MVDIQKELDSLLQGRDIFQTTLLILTKLSSKTAALQLR